MKRTTSIALVLMGAAAVGGTAYWVSSPDCRNAPAGSTQSDQCRTSGSGSSGGRGSGYWGSGSQSSEPHSSSNSAHPATAPATAHGGFGSTGHAFSGGGS